MNIREGSIKQCALILVSTFFSTLMSMSFGVDSNLPTCVVRHDASGKFLSIDANKNIILSATPFRWNYSAYTGTVKTTVLRLSRLISGETHYLAGNSADSRKIYLMTSGNPNWNSSYPYVWYKSYDSQRRGSVLRTDVPMTSQTGNLGSYLISADNNNLQTVGQNDFQYKYPGKSGNWSFFDANSSFAIKNNKTGQYLSVDLSRVKIDKSTGKVDLSTCVVMSSNKFYWKREEFRTQGTTNQGIYPYKFSCMLGNQRMYLSGSWTDKAQVQLVTDGSQAVWWPFNYSTPVGKLPVSKLVLYTCIDLFISDDGIPRTASPAPDKDYWSFEPLPTPQ